MSSPRRPIDPPQLAGYIYKSKLGAGGFADVFLYEREFPRQEVAIKVLDRLVGKDEGRNRFAAEANAMASLSTHPYIVTIFHADVSPQNHPYLVMEYYPGANYSVRSKSERFSVAQVLRLGVQVASAVETAHRAGILHRDIKPANILTSAYGRPGLTDFGIASSLEGGGEDTDGLSIPWSPPEALESGSPPDERSDIYSLAATLYTLLAGHSPFEQPGESNRSIDLIDHIERTSLPRFARTDVPSSLYRLLAQAMAKQPRSRPPSAAEFARSLQAIEVEQRYDLTPLEVEANVATPTETQAIDADAGSTRLKGPTVVESQARFSAPTDTVARSAVQRASETSRSAAPIRGVPFAVPKVATPPPVAATSVELGRSEPAKKAAAASYHQEQPVTRRPEYRGPTYTPLLKRITRATWIGIAVTLLIITGVALVLVLAGSSAKHPLPKRSSAAPQMVTPISMTNVAGEFAGNVIVKSPTRIAQWWRMN